MSKLKVRQIFRKARPYSSADKIIDGFDNHFHATLSAGQNLVLLDSGINPIRSVEAIDGERQPAVLIRCVNGQWEQVSSGCRGAVNCGVKPVPQVGYRIGCCVNGQWQQVSEGFSSGVNCGVKPVPRVGYRIGRCVNGNWEQISI